MTTIFFVDDILQLNPEGIKWCENDQKNYMEDKDKFDDFSKMLFRFVKYNDNHCIVKLIHPHNLYLEWGGEDSADLSFPEQYLQIKKDP